MNIMDMLQEIYDNQLPYEDNTPDYLFRDLNDRAQWRAIDNYIEGWQETHEHGDMSESEVIKALLADINSRYNYNGRLL